MISAMIQAIKRDENNVVVLDGQILSGDEKTSGVVQNIIEFSFNLSAKLENNAGEFLGDAFSDFKKIKNFEFASQIGYEIEFAPKPNE